MDKFYRDATPRNPDVKSAVYLRGIKAPIWVATNPDIAAFATRRLNARYASGALRGWDAVIQLPDGQAVFQKGWSVDDLILAARRGELSPEVIARASTLIQAIAVVANAKEKNP